MPIIRTFISPEELWPERIVTIEELIALARGLNRVETLHFLGFLNLLLSSAATETELTGELIPVRDVQHWLFREVVSASLLRDLQAQFRATSLLDRPILHRTQLLFAIRLVATYGDPVAGNRLQVRADFDVIGDLLFLINGLFRTPPSTSRHTLALHVATAMGPLHETENPPRIELSWPRMTDLFTNRLPTAVADRAELERLEQIALFSTGFSVQAWLDLSFLLFSFWSAVTFRELMADRGRAYLNIDGHHEIISPEILRRAVDGLAIPFDDLPDYLRFDQFSRTILFDLTPFRTRPLWRMPDGRVLCLDAALLMERLGPNAFWGVMNALDTSERRRHFTGAWGQAFEDYCLDVLERIFAAKKWQFVRNPMDAAINEELWDGLAVRETTAIVQECKGTFMKSSEKYSGVEARFMRGLTQKFGRVKHGGVHQLVRGISRVWFQQVAQTPIRLSSIQDVFPVLIVQDPILECGPVVRLLSDRFEVAIRRARRNQQQHTPEIWPLTVMTADDMDRISAGVHVTGAALHALLKRFHRSHRSRIISFGEFLSGHHPDFGFPDRAREVIRARFTEKTEATMQRFRSAEYGGTRAI